MGGLTADEEFRLAHGIKFDAELLLDVECVLGGPYEKEAGAWAPLVRLLGTHQARPVLGWTSGMQWCLCTSKPMLRVYDGADRFVIFWDRGHQLRLKAYGRPEVAVKVKLFAERMAEEIKMAIEDTADFTAQVQTFVEARTRLNNEKYPSWDAALPRDTLDDPMVKMLRENYRTEYRKVQAECQAIMLERVLYVTAALGARFVSVSPQHIIVFEGIRTDGPTVPVAIEVAKVLNVLMDDTRGYAEVRLHGCIAKEDEGVYDLRGGFQTVKTKVAKALHPQTANWRMVDRRFDDSDLNEWMTQAGCGVEPKRRW